MNGVFFNMTRVCRLAAVCRSTRRLLGFVLAFAVGGLPLSALAQVTLVTSVQKEVIEMDENGQPVRRLVDAANVVPGDTLHYVISFSNKGDQTVDPDSIVITNPLPPDTVYLEGTAQGSGTVITFSVDSGNSFGRPEELKVEKEGEEVAAQAADYTTIRWAFTNALESGRTGDVSFSVRLR
ncbi:MAG: DUF11 domain-containing protein [Pseudomonadales bacterium]|nr:DUF11 domain-containing protein [Pseudomonadales bacterium]